MAFHLYQKGERGYAVRDRSSWDATLAYPAGSWLAFWLRWHKRRGWYSCLARLRRERRHGEAAICATHSPLSRDQLAGHKNEKALKRDEGLSEGYIRGLETAMKEGTVRSLSPEATAYALMGIGHFVALRWIIWPQQDEEAQEKLPHLPDDIFASVMELIMHGLTPDSKEQH